MKHKLLIFLSACMFLYGCQAADNTSKSSIISSEYRDIFYSLVSSAENSSLDYEKNYEVR